jgi:hypothetical protein
MTHFLCSTEGREGRNMSMRGEREREAESDILLSTWLLIYFS